MAKYKVIVTIEKYDPGLDQYNTLYDEEAEIAEVDTIHEAREIVSELTENYQEASK